jgi:hypothetical protein
MAEEDRRADNAILLQYVKSIDERTGRIETAVTDALTAHQEKDDGIHEEIQKKINGLEKFRLVATFGALSLIGGSGAAKLGALDKIISIFTSTGAGP